MKKRMIRIILAFLNLFALANVASASTVLSYQPELPKALKK